ncbi:MAG TPA: hypothetical protein VN663_23080 [Ramlibacter sp.]|nr:hypothetical protein [Ramlibacter sp.]
MTTDTAPPTKRPRKRPQPREPKYIGRVAPSVDDAIAAIRAYVAFKGWAIYTLAHHAQLPRSSLRFFNDPTWAPKSDTLRVLYTLIPPDFDPSVARTPPPPKERKPQWPVRKRDLPKIPLV